MALTYTGKLVIGSLTETGKLVIGSLTETGVGVVGLSSSIVEGGSTAFIAISAQGGGEVVVDIVEGGSTASIEISAEGSGIAIKQGGSTAEIIISAQGGGSTYQEFGGGSEASIAISSEGSGFAIKQGGSTATIIISAEGGTGSIIAEGGSIASIIVSAEGQGTTLRSGSSEATIVISTPSLGQKIAYDGSEATIEISATGEGRHYYVGAVITVGADKRISIDRKLFSMQNEKLLALVNIDESILFANCIVFLRALLPNGTMVVKGGYSCPDGSIYVWFGDGDNMLAYDGNLELQFEFAELGNDGVTVKTKKKSQMSSKKIHPSVC